MGDQLFIKVSNCNEAHVADGELSPIEDPAEQIACLRTMVEHEGAIEIENDSSPSDVEECAARALNVVAICATWNHYNTNMAKVIWSLCGKDSWNKRRVVKALEVGYEDNNITCNTDSYPDNELLTVALGVTGLVLMVLCLGAGKPVDRKLNGPVPSIQGNVR